MKSATKQTVSATEQTVSATERTVSVTKLDVSATTTDLYLESLTPKEKQAYEIAKSYLGSLFTLEKTTGFIAWSTSTRLSDPPV